jgi:hypothetical protein
VQISSQIQEPISSNFGNQEIKIVHLPHNFGNARNQTKLFWETNLKNKQNCANVKEQQLLEQSSHWCVN